MRTPRFRDKVNPLARTKGLINVQLYDRPTWEEVCPLYADAIAAKLKAEFPRGVPAGKRGPGRPRRDPLAYVACEEMRLWYEHWTNMKIGQSIGEMDGPHGPYFETIRLMLAALGSNMNPSTIIQDQKGYVKKYAASRRLRAKQRYRPKRRKAI